MRDAQEAILGIDVSDVTQQGQTRWLRDRGPHSEGRLAYRRSFYILRALYIKYWDAREPKR